MNTNDFLHFMDQPNLQTRIEEEFNSIILEEEEMSHKSNQKSCLPLVHYIRREKLDDEANFVDGYDTHRKFLCLRNPCVKDRDVFWQAVWDNQVPIIVMTCRLSDNSYQYWSPKERYTLVQEVYLEEDCASSNAKGFWGSVAAQTTPLLKPPLLKNTILLSVLFVAVYFCFNPYTVWLPYMADGFMKSLEKGERGLTFCEMLRSSQNDTASRDPELAADCALNTTAMTLVFAMDFLLAVVNIGLAGMKRWVGRKTLLIGLQMTAGLAGLSLVFCTIWQLTAALLVTYVAGNLNFGILSTFSVDIFPTYVKAMGVCLTLMVGRGSAVFGINLLKSMLVSNCESSFYLFAGITIFGGLIGLLLPGEKQKLNEKKIAQASTIGTT